MQIKYEKISYGYYKQQEILQNISLELQDGITVLCGNNGSGKSTLLNIINLIYTPIEGNIIINNEKYSKRKKQYYQQKIATVYQFSDIELFNLTVEEDLLYAVKVQKKDIKQAKVKIKEYFSLFKLKQDILKMSPFKLSGGQKKKVAIISALILQPEILILDEPLIALDNKAKKEIIQVIKKLKNKVKIIIVLHDYNYIYEIADTVIELKDKGIANNCSKDIFFNKKYQSNQQSQLTTILRFCKILNLDYQKVKNYQEQDLLKYLQGNYELS